jgi:putative ABC transport system permease protein
MAAQEMLATSGVNTLVVALKQTEDTDAIAASLAKRHLRDGMEVKTWLQLNDFYTKTVEMYDAQFGALRIIILLMVMLSVANSVNMSVFERVGEFGTMMALGNRGMRVFQLIIAENAIIGLMGATMGVILGVLLALAISVVGISMPPPPNSDIAYTAHILVVPSVIAGAFAVGLIATIAAALLPAMRVRRIPVVDALRQSI